MFINCGLRKLLYVDFFIALLLVHVLRHIYNHFQDYLSKSFSFLSRGVSVKKPPTWEAMSFETRTMYTIIVQTYIPELHYLYQAATTYIAKEICIYRINC